MEVEELPVCDQSRDYRDNDFKAVLLISLQIKVEWLYRLLWDTFIFIW